MINSDCSLPVVLGTVPRFLIQGRLLGVISDNIV